MISGSLERLQASNRRIKQNIANAYLKAEEKGASLPEVQDSSNLAETIGRIEQGWSEWKPEPDWYDIDKILEEDTEDYPAKMICLLTDSQVTSTIYSLRASKIKTSDGVVYEGGDITNTILHTWNTECDKECGLGYKTRYVIYYFNSTNCTMNLTEPCCKLIVETLYCIFKGLNINFTYENYTNGFFYNRMMLEYVKCIDTVFNKHPILNQSCGLRRIENFECRDRRNTNTHMYANCSSLVEYYIDSLPNNAGNYFESTRFKKIDIDTSNTANFERCFYNAKVEVLESLDLNKATIVTNMFLGASYLVAINNVWNIKISGMNFGSCTNLNRDSLLRIKGACYDYSRDEGTHHIVIGSMNLGKFTEDELAEWLECGWTVS